MLSTNSSGTWFRATYILLPTTWIFGSGSLKSMSYDYSLAIQISGPSISGRLRVLATYTASFRSYLHLPLMLLQLKHELNSPSTRVLISRP